MRVHPNLNEDQRATLQRLADTQYLRDGRYNYEQLSECSDELVGFHVEPSYIRTMAQNYRWAEHSKQFRQSVMTEVVRLKDRPLRDKEDLATEAAKTASALKLINMALINLSVEKAKMLIRETNEDLQSGDPDRMYRASNRLPEDFAGLQTFAASSLKMFEAAHSIEMAAVSTVSQEAKDPTQAGKGQVLTKAFEGLSAEDLVALAARVQELKEEDQ